MIFRREDAVDHRFDLAFLETSVERQPGKGRQALELAVLLAKT